VMRTLLQLLTRPSDPLANKIASLQRAHPEVKVETLDLTIGTPDYHLLLERILEADSVQVW
jgi:hypothetical protein